MKDLDVDDRVLEDERELDPQHTPLEELEEEEVQDEVAPDRGVSHFEAVANRVTAILEGRDVALDEAHDLTEEERLAIELLQECVSGRDARTHRIVYAERRLEMLELSLATLQPAFALALTPELDGLRDAYDTLVEEVGALRDKLDRLGDAQEELMGYRFEQEQEAGKPDEEDKPGEPVPEEGEPPRESTLSGKPGDKPVEEPEAPSTLYGKPADKPVEKPATKSTVYDPD